MDPTTRFTDRADDYRRFRPGYPVGLIALIQKLVPPDGLIADVGAGTGILTRLLLEAGFSVVAVEPNAVMLNLARQDLADFPRFRTIEAPAEGTTLAASSVSAITAAQAFHWFTFEAARSEFRRILQPGGTVFLVWNQRQVEESPFSSEYEALLQSLGESYRSVTHRNSAKVERLEELFQPGTMRRDTFPNPQIMTWEQLRGRFLSSSYTPPANDPLREEYLNKLQALFDQYQSGGTVTFDQITEVFYGPVAD